ncbi:MAG: [FeFe] hydrogenase H-cluster maturation GTPase HydF [Syntrophobacterales bacterium]|jgi:[FeFe] hydrogenase H-cluster maturation GTPase HydF|nr:[FeFe] hydrogenase H-cluster maturation GTPase HydF [Syntrophobacterales bacterium]
MNTTPKGNRLHIAILGRTNVGKSSLLNYILDQELAITSPVAGTTTDVVEKAAELLPLGPVLFLDTAGLDDTSSLGKLRVQKTENVYERADIILLVTEPDQWTHYEETVWEKAAKKKIPLIIMVNKADLQTPSPEFLRKIKERSDYVIALSTTDDGGREKNIALLKQHLLAVSPEDYLAAPSLVGDLLPSRGGLVLLVIPIDDQAPRGRLILPQVQTIRDALDHLAVSLAVRETQVKYALSLLQGSPDIVIADSQAILQVAAHVPENIPCTTFSILMARQKGDLIAAAKGAAAIESLHPRDKVLIAESCSHHPLQDDIGRVKIPRWLREYAGGELDIDLSSGRDYPSHLEEYKVIIHCGGCMLNRREMLSRISRAQESRVPITNYGLAISLTQGLIRRVLSPFPQALAAYEKARKES